MKKRVLLIVLAVVLVFSLSACGGSKYAGEYNCTKASMEVDGEEVSLDADELFEGGASIALKDNGKAVITLSGESADATWEVNGSELTLTMEGSESTGTISDTSIELDLLGTGMKCIFEKKGESEE